MMKKNFTRFFDQFIFEQPLVYERLGLLRVTTCLITLVLLILASYDQYHVEMSSFLFNAKFPFYFFPNLGEFFHTFKALTVLFGITYLIGYKIKFSGPAFASSFYLISYYTSCFQENYSVTNGHLNFFLIALCFAQTSYYSIDRFLSPQSLENRNPFSQKLSSFILVFLMGFIAVFYFQAGLSKLLKGGIDWFLSGDTVFIKTVLEGTVFGKWLTQWPWLFPFFSIYTGVFEFGFFLFFFFPQTHRYFVISAFLFHIGTYLVLGINFWFLWGLFPALYFSDVIFAEKKPVDTKKIYYAYN